MKRTAVIAAVAALAIVATAAPAQATNREVYNKCSSQSGVWVDQNGSRGQTVKPCSTLGWESFPGHFTPTRFYTGSGWCAQYQRWTGGFTYSVSGPAWRSVNEGDDMIVYAWDC